MKMNVLTNIKGRLIDITVTLTISNHEGNSEVVAAIAADRAIQKIKSDLDEAFTEIDNNQQQKGE